MDVLTTRDLTPQELDAVAGGNAFVAVVAIASFVFLNLDKFVDSYNGLMDGLSDGYAGPSGPDATAVCTA